jgi:hypothetical protein
MPGQSNNAQLKLHNRSAIQQILRIVRNPHAHHRAHKSQLLDHVVCHINPFHIFNPYSFKINYYFNTVCLFLLMSAKYLQILGFWQLCTRLHTVSIPSTRTALLSALSFIITGKGHRSISASPPSIVFPHVKIFSSALHGLKKNQNFIRMMFYIKTDY